MTSYPSTTKPSPRLPTYELCTFVYRTIVSLGIVDKTNDVFKLIATNAHTFWTSQKPIIGGDIVRGAHKLLDNRPDLPRDHRTRDFRHDAGYHIINGLSNIVLVNGVIFRVSKYMVIAICVSCHVFSKMSQTPTLVHFHQRSNCW